MALELRKVKHWVAFAQVIILNTSDLRQHGWEGSTAEQWPPEWEWSMLIQVCYFILKLYLLITGRIVKLIFVRLMILE